MNSNEGLKPSARFKPITKTDLFSGKGSIKIWDLKAQREAGPFKASLWCELEAGGQIGRHHQEHCDEIVLCLSGFGTATIGHECFGLEPGVQVFLKQGQLLSIKAGTQQSLIYLIIKA